MGALLGPNFPTNIALAVSGGGDSMAMLNLAAGWARVYGVKLWVATVDHGLRPESASEAAMVADECATLGLHHNTLIWKGWDGTNNLQDAARQARLDLLQDWSGLCAHLLMAHTQDDQAETVLMRLIRGSGVDGLSGMAAKRRLLRRSGLQQRPPGWPPRKGDALDDPGPLTVLRPLLGVQRAALRHYCTTLKIPFVDDPSNDDERFSRVRMRRLIKDEGWDVARLARTADQMARARKVLMADAETAFATLNRAQFAEGGYVSFDRDGLAQVLPEIALRVFAMALSQISGSPYRPRLSALEDVIDIVVAGGTATLQGCLLTADKDRIVICRELQAVTARCSTQELWDDRWALHGPHAAALQIGPLGDALSDCPDWRSTGHPRAALRVSPAIWHDNRLIAAPLAGFSGDWQARIVANSLPDALAH